jgi:uncharacterized protein (DUF885 family)
MRRFSPFLRALVVVSLLLGGRSFLEAAPGPAQLVALFTAWRAFQKPKRVDGVPDYTAPAMAAQHRELAAFQARLKAMDPAGWPIPAQVDRQILRAEMNGLDFDHRVLRPWANNPAFYVTVFDERSDQPAREGPFADGAVELWSYASPLPAADAAAVNAGLRVIPRLLNQAKGNLVGQGRDLWVYGAKALRAQAAQLAQLATKEPAVREAARGAQAATESLAAWVEAQLPQKTGPSAIGIAHYEWYLRRVQLLPHGWQDEVTLLERELARALSLLALEEAKHAKLPEQMPIASAEEHARRFPPAVEAYMAFLRDHEVMSLPDYLKPALAAHTGTFHAGPREFFTEVDYRDPEVMRTHGYHWFDLARMAREPHPDPIRRGALLYNLFNTRTEGHATGWEEWMLQLGMFDDRPRSRELIYILLAERAARGLAALRMISGEFSLEQAAVFASAHTPRGWLSLKGALVRDEQHLYLQQPGYGTCYITGKAQLEELLAARKEQLGEAFTLKRYMDEFNAAGLIPASLLRWELTGKMPGDVRRMLAEP